MKHYLNEIIYVFLLAMTFTFFVFVDELSEGPAAKTKPAVNTNRDLSINKDVYVNDYTFTPTGYINAYN